MELTGVSASSGYAMGYAYVMRSRVQHSGKIIIDSRKIGLELERFEIALSQTEVDLHHLSKQLKISLRESEAEMVEALLELLQDDEFYLRILHKISKNCLQAETAVSETTDEIVARVQKLDDIYLVERSAEIRDISNRLMDHLMGTTESVMEDVNKKRILITNELSTSYSAQLNPKFLVGCATAIGGIMSHSAIIARSMGLPFVVGIGEQLHHIQDGQFLILDGVEGKLIVEPDEVQVAYYTKLKSSLSAAENNQDILPSFNSTAVTSDRHPIDLLANISSIEGALDAKNNGAMGIGLFRTEFLYLNRATPPTEEEQFEIYREVALIFGKESPIIIRTFDIGGDKLPLFHQHAVELNPLLGYRGIRVSLDQVEMFKTQLRAILKASSFGQLKIMFPMIAVLSEWKAAKFILEEVKEELRLNGIDFNLKIEIGMMIEVPSAALNAAQFAREVDFFSIGTNDLVQYLMAVDRGNAALSYLNNGFDPTVFRLIHHVIGSAHKYKKWVSLCGDMAGHPDAAAVFIGMGLQKLSMNVNELAHVRLKISQLTYTQMQKDTKHILKLNSAKEVIQYIEKKS